MFLGRRGLRRRSSLLLAVGGALSVASIQVACGSRTGLHGPPSDPDAGVDGATDAGPDGPECTTDDDCVPSALCVTARCSAGRCVDGEITCDDGDECTADSCNRDNGQCEFKPVVRDEDEDGFYGPRPGYAAGEPGSCGDDCDDTSPLAFPGGEELCDGVDNDCNGVVDDNARYVPAGGGDVRISGPDLRQSGGGGLVYAETNYVATYTGQLTHWTDFAQGISDDGSPLATFPETPITNVNNDNFTGPVVWTGAVYATVWEDRRDADYEIYFNRFDPGGNKLGPDVRVSDAAGFSLNPALIWNGSQYIVMWQEERASVFALVGRVLDSEGKAVSEVNQFTLPTEIAESPRIAEGERRLGVAFNMNQGIGQEIGFLTIGADLAESSATRPSSLDADAVDPSLVWLGDRFVVAWEKRDVTPGDAIWGALVDEDGNVLRPATPLTSGASFARSHAMIPLGDRFLLVWADDHDGNYELYSKMLSNDLEELTGRERITFDGSDSVGPIASFGPNGDVGVLFDDRRSGAWQTYFTRLECAAG
ncbi:MAG: putative metal-binding motif-containing protein, partial [Myxococcales bacterium]|nr:putative metal-binding motif-containing protein [Myxococcales bacterium]